MTPRGLLLVYSLRFGSSESGRKPRGQPSLTAGNMRADGAFRALLLLLFLLSSRASAVIVPPPTNVTVSCHNTKVTASWEYSQQQPQTSFIVHMSGSAGIYTSETTDRQYDLSHLVWAHGERFMGFLYVTVAAKQGNSRSINATSKSFSFNELKTTDITCKLNFPPVHLKMGDSGATVSFRNPLHHYVELQRAVKKDTASFTFMVSSGGVDVSEGCTATQEDCRRDVTFPEGAEKCVSLTGWLASNSVNKVFFQKTDRICPSNSADIHVITLILLLSVIVFVIVVVTIAICKTKAWTMKTPIFPESLDSLLRLRSEQDLKHFTVPNTLIISAVSVNEPCKRLSVSSEEENLQDCSSGSELRASAGFYVEGRLSESSNQEPEAERLLPETHGMDDDSADEEVASPYDRPQTLQLDMGDGVKVTGYSRR